MGAPRDTRESYIISRMVKKVESRLLHTRHEEDLLSACPPSSSAGPEGEIHDTPGARTVFWALR